MVAVREAELDREELELIRSMTNQPVSDEVGDVMERLRMRAHTYARYLVRNVPPSREKSLAKTHLEDSIMWAIKALVLHGELKVLDGPIAQQEFQLDG